MSKILVLKPHMSEKAYALSHSTNTFVFDVPRDANKLTVESAVKDQFKVEVATVNIAVSKGKPKRTIRRSGRSVAGIGKRADIKKAYVTLKEGSTLPFFAEEDEAREKAEKKAEKAEKKAEKKDKGSK